MPGRVALVAALLTTIFAPAWAAPVRQAGEWQTTLDDGKPMIACFVNDKAFDEKTLTQAMARIPGASCKVSSLSTSGDVTSYAMECTVGGSQMTTSGAITAIGPDAFTAKVHSHGGAIVMPGGKTMAMPDTDTVTVSRRLGPCKPGDRQVND